MTLGTASAYPASLPTPQQASIQSVERRVLAPDGGFFEARAGQTDRLSLEEIAFPPLTPAQALMFDSWWRDDLVKGGLWFAAAWPRPEGQFPVARRFIRPPAWEFIGAPDSGYWRVTASFEVRGVGELPINPDPASAWNPEDMITQALPNPVELTEDNRLATRETNSDSYEGGVRGFLSHGASGKWYLELEVVSVGAPGETQNMSFGLIDDTIENEDSTPPTDSSDAAVAGGEYVLAYSRFDGAVYSSRPANPTLSGDMGSAPSDGDIYGFAWHVGTDVQIYRNGVLGLTVPFDGTMQMFPYMSAGETLVNGPNLDGTGESVRIRTGKRQFAFQPPSGYFPWG